ncbi:MAG: type I methionyl aminopeptidase [Bacilli bacterium]
MITIKSVREIELMKIAGEIVGKTHLYLEQFIKEGISTKELDKLANDFILKSDATPSFKGLYGFPGTICISINEEVVHGIPGNRKLKNGDIVTLDIGACYRGYHGDSAWTYSVGEISSEKKRLLEQTKESLYVGLSVIKDGIHVGDIGYAISEYAKKCHLGVVKELVGHGIGSHVHEEPDIPNFGNKKTGPILKEGMVIAVEPMLNLGSSDVVILDDDWTIVTDDNKPSAHFEHTVLVTKDGYTILTKR